ncbi:MAG: chemotaxis protein [Rhodobacteraceae bacterium]|nr:chemotaxis protein [Paracoccaceae bacterium]
MTQSDCDPTLSSVAFEGLRDMLYRESGIVISSSKSSLMVSRLNRRLRHLGLTDFDRYLLALEQDETGQERREFVASMTTNVTSFFREGHHFKQLARDILPPLIARAKSQDARLRIWSAGCSTGEEAYSIAITLLDLLPDAARYDIKILATDIDTYAIDKARAGRYRAGLTKGLSADQISRYFQEEHHQGEPWLNIRAEPRHLIAFEPLNLHGPWPMRGPFDVIFCRNVVIYFDEATRTELWQRFAKIVAPGGWLFTGHSERLDTQALAHFNLNGTTSYRRSAEAQGDTTYSAPMALKMQQGA